MTLPIHHIIFFLSSPEHMHCLASVWGPLAPPGTGVLAVQKLGVRQVSRGHTVRSDGGAKHSNGAAAQDAVGG